MKLIITGDLRDAIDSYNREEISYSRMVEILNEKANERLKAINYSQCCKSFKLLNWTTIKLMKYQLKKTKRQLTKQEHSFTKRAFSDMIKSYESAIMFLEANSK